jgi:hypothetical protein
VFASGWLRRKIRVTVSNSRRTSSTSAVDVTVNTP